LKRTDIQGDNFSSRLKEVRAAKGMTLEQFYGPVTEHVSNCSAIENGKRKIGKRLSKDIICCHRINESWLITGEGEMFDKAGSSAAVAISEQDYQSVPFFNVNLSEIHFGGQDLFMESPEYYVNFRPFNDCDAYLPIYGDSMYPKYASGEIIAIREIRNFDIIQWGEAYLVVTDERANSIVTVKLLFEHPDEGKLILRSSNPNFKGDTVIGKEFIKKLFIVKGKVTRNQL
jgi:phage repressor protein C with HTH and peptisase S24 domain